MSTTKHTPGPWVAGKDYLERAAKGYRVTIYRQSLNAVGLSFGDTVGEMRANAALHAAAPELLAALQEVHEILFKKWKGKLINGSDEKIYDKVRAVMRKHDFI